jgi:hypothetical protein
MAIGMGSSMTSEALKGLAMQFGIGFVRGITLNFRLSKLSFDWFVFVETKDQWASVQFLRTYICPAGAARGLHFRPPKNTTLVKRPH